MFNVQANCTTGITPDPIVDSITVDIAGNVTICWQGVADPDINYYTIFTINPVTLSHDSINVVPDPGNCFTLPALNNSETQSVVLGVRAVDNCGNPSNLGVNYHNTIYLRNTVDICAASINLEWNPYDDFNSGSNVSYDVFLSINAGPYSLLGSTTDTTFVYPGIVNGFTYDFYVRGIENNGAGPISSSSNDIQVNSINFLKDPQFNYLYTATVVDSQQINVQFYIDTAADISHYNITRATSLTGTFEIIDAIPAYTGMNPLINFTDIDVNANSTHYVYKIETINSCGDLKLKSNIGKTIWLKAESDGVGAKNTLTITKYDDWLGREDVYEIYRSIGGIWGSSPIATLLPFSDTTLFYDHIIDITEGDGEFCYKVIAKENNIIHVGGLVPATSTSNESCVIQQPLLYVPNAFVPLSPHNYEFKPVLTFSDPQAYLLQIYNRWGQLIFETKDINEGWNGAVNNSGKMSQVDSYVYLIKFKSADGEEHSKRGVVSLLR